MNSLVLDCKVLGCFADFIELYLGEAPKLDSIKEYIEIKCVEKNIVEVYNAGILTQEEVCNLLLGHLFTRFVLNQNEVREVSDDVIADIFKKIKTLIFS